MRTRFLHDWTILSCAGKKGGLLVMVLLMTGCSQFSSKPNRVDQHFGEAVRAMQYAQTYNPATRKNPNPNPVMTRDGQKSVNTLNSTYRNDIWLIKERRSDSDSNKF